MTASPWHTESEPELGVPNEREKNSTVCTHHETTAPKTAHRSQVPFEFSVAAGNGLTSEYAPVVCQCHGNTYRNNPLPNRSSDRTVFDPLAPCVDSENWLQRTAIEERIGCDAGRVIPTGGLAEGALYRFYTR